MLGFFGTVIGMIKAFFNISKAGQNVDASLLAGGIYEAMITTAAGLAVGILAFIGYNLLVSLVEKVVFQMEATSVEFVDLLQEWQAKMNLVSKASMAEVWPRHVADSLQLRLGVETDFALTNTTGLRADLAVWDADHPAELSYRIGFNPLHRRIFGGTE